MSGSTRALSVRQFFGRKGLLSRKHPSFEFRQGQLDMATAVEEAFRDKRHLIVEAGTGTGKTLAYLVPAIFSGGRVIVSTGTKNLQEQIFFKDLPFLQDVLEYPLQVCYMKGRSNYLCRQKLYDAENQPVLDGLEEIADFQIIRDWEQRTETGDRAEIRTLPENSSAWPKLDARRDMCTGQKCPQFDRCFITQMQRRAQESDLIVVNHHLLFADLAIKGDEAAAGIIPDYRSVIFDEAHEVEDVAGQYFGIAISSYQFEDLIRDVSRTMGIQQLLTAAVDRALDGLGRAVEYFLSLLPNVEGRAGFPDRKAFLERNREHYQAVVGALELTGAHLKDVPNAPEELMPLFRRTQEMILKMRILFEDEDDSRVYWLERRGRGTFVQATPIDVAPLLAERLFAPADTIVLTSATLAVGGDFRFVEQRLGVENARTLIAPSPFDYYEQTLLYVPQRLPDPRTDLFASMASEEILALLRHSRGRAFVLFTSYQQMRSVHDRISFALDYPVLLQGTGPRTALLEEFKSTPNAVLFATASFWQGVDVPGEQLSCVIIDRLPFAVPSDPVVDARIRRIKEVGGNPFYDYQIPQAAIALKQGFGRLIRSRSDRGVLVLLDNRITKQRYGQVFFDSLPDYRFTTKIAEVEKFFHV